MGTPCTTAFVTENSEATITPNVKIPMGSGNIPSKGVAGVVSSQIPMIPYPIRCIFFHTNILCSLEDAILVGIFFSGYLSAKDIFSSVILINKQIQSLSKQYINYLQLRSLNIDRVRFTRSLCNLQFLDLSYASSDIVTNPDFALSKLINPSNKLVFLSLRGTRATNLSLLDTNYKFIEYLDVSKMKRVQSDLINDIFIADYVKNMSYMKVLDLSMTGITDHSIALIAKYLPGIKVLSIALCERITDAMISDLSQLFLCKLDVTGSTELTTNGFKSLFTKNYDDKTYRPFLKDSLVDFKASFLPRVTDELIHFVAKHCTNIKYFEFRGCSVIRPKFREEANRAIQTAIFKTTDFPHEKDPFDQTREILKYCPQIHWPYENRE